MYVEHGVFNDEGCVERQLSAEQAQVALAAYQAEGDEHAYIDEVCPDHDDQPRTRCEDCDDDGEHEECDECGDYLNECACGANG